MHMCFQRIQYSCSAPDKKKSYKRPCTDIRAMRTIHGYGREAVCSDHWSTLQTQSKCPYSFEMKNLTYFSIITDANQFLRIRYHSLFIKITLRIKIYSAVYGRYFDGN